MKEYIKKFDSLSGVDGYVMRDIPFIGAINDNPQNIANDKLDRQITVENNTLIVHNTIILPDEILKFWMANRVCVYNRLLIIERYPEIKKIWELDDYGPMEYVYMHVIQPDGTEQIEQGNLGLFYSLNGEYIPHTVQFWIEINIPSNIIPGGWYAKSNIIKPYYPPGHDYWSYYTVNNNE